MDDVELVQLSPEDGLDVYEMEIDKMLADL